MKRIYFFLCFPVLMILFISTSCTKQVPATDSGSGPGPGTGSGIIISPPPTNRPPVAYAGFDFTGISYDEITLSGAAVDPEGSVSNTTWTKIAGPSCNILSPQSLNTVVTGLITGEYQFELLVRDNFGLSGRDTIIVKIIGVGQVTSPLTFFNLPWMCPMGCTVTINNRSSQIQSNTPIRVFIKFVNSTIWQEVEPISQYPLNNAIYYYELNSNNNLLIYTEHDMNTNIDVRITF